MDVVTLSLDKNVLHLDMLYWFLMEIMKNLREIMASGIYVHT